MTKASREAAARAIEENGAQGKVLKEITLSNGIVLGIKPVPPWLVRRSVGHLKAPTPPMVMNEDKGREEENPADPDYQKALREYQTASVDSSMNVLLGAGTYVKEVPEGMWKPEDSQWVDFIEELGVPVNKENPTRRYLDWMELYALTSSADVTDAMRAVSQATGIEEGEVDEAVESFRGRKKRGAD